MIRPTLLATLIGLSLSSWANAEEPTWPQWRGPNRDGTVPAQPAFPKSLNDKALSQVWQVTDLPPSYSGPIVSDELVFTTGTKDKTTETVTAYNRKTGKLVWEQSWPGSMTVPFFAAKNGSWIRATPAYDGERLYVAGIRDVLYCLDGQTGQELWSYDAVKELGTPLPSFGFVCSPLVDEKAVYVQAGASFLKIDKKSGKLLWQSLKDDGGMNGSAFSSPIRAIIAGKDQLIVQTRTELAGVDPETGKSLWTQTVPSMRGMNILTPVAYDDGVFTSTYGGNTRWFPLQKTTDGLQPAEGWQFKYEGNMTTAVIVDEYAYILGKDRRFLCVNLKTGKEAWGSDKRFGEYWSMVTDGKQILALDNQGILYLIEANPKEFIIADERKLTTPNTWAHLTVVGNELYIRDISGLTRYDWK